MPARKLRVTVATLSPERTRLGYVLIENDGTGDEHLGNYTITKQTADGQPLETVCLRQFPRKLGAWELAVQSLMRLSHPAMDPEWEGEE
jgi:hypothetical protein